MYLSIYSAFDMRGREVYFDQNSTEVTFFNGMNIKLNNPSWTMKTDDLGYFYRAFNSYLTGNNYSFWKSYDAFFGIMIAGIMSSIIWLIGGIMEIYKFFYIKWSLANRVKLSFDLIQGLLVCILALLIFLGGNGYVFYRICILLYQIADRQFL